MVDLAPVSMTAAVNRLRDARGQLGPVLETIDQDLPEHRRHDNLDAAMQKTFLSLA